MTLIYDPKNTTGKLATKEKTKVGKQMNNKIDVHIENRELEERFIKEQLSLQKKIDLDNRVELAKVKTVAGIDLAYWNKGDKEYANCCIVVIDYNTQELIEEVYSVGEIDVPYIPGCLAYREIPLFMETYKKLTKEPDVIVFDGNGYLHARHMGIATHAGILLNKPTIGVAKSYYKIENVDFTMPEDKAGAYTDIVINDEVYGRAVRTHKGVKPVFVSTGNMIDIETSMQLAMSLVNKESRIPISTRLADLMTHRVRMEQR